MDDDIVHETSDDAWADLLVGLAAAWTTSAPDGENAANDDGERYLAAARIVSRRT